MSSVQYIVHEQPVRRSGSNYITMVDLSRFGFPGLLEQMWLEPDQVGSFSVACLPFRVYGLALGDEVELNAECNAISRLNRRSGHRVLRIFLAKSLTENEFLGLRARLIAAIDAKSAASEWSGDRHLAVDVLPGESVDYLQEIVEPYLSGQTVYWEWSDAEEFNSQS
jgi:hypothetical protein